MRFVSLFTGVGGFDLGLELIGMECTAQVELDKNARAVLNLHWPDVPKYTDVRRCHGEKWIGSRRDAEWWDWLPAVDLVVGGFPCQDVSVAGKRAGLAGKRSGLWFEFHRLLAELRPNWVVIENVPGLLSSNGGRDFAVILRGLVELGYGVSWRVLDSQFFGVAQRRRRLFIVGSLGSGRSSSVLFESESVPGNPTPSRQARQGAAADPESRLRSGGAVAFDWTAGHGNDQSWQGKSRVWAVKKGDYAGSLSTTKVQAVAGQLGESDAATAEVIAFTERTREGGRNVEWQENPSYSLNNPGEGGRAQERMIAVIPQDAPADEQQLGKAYGLTTYNTPKFAEDTQPTTTVPSSSGGGQPPAVVFTQNQRDEVRDLNDLAGAVAAEPGMKQQTYVAFRARYFTRDNKTGNADSVSEDHVPPLRASSQNGDSENIIAIRTANTGANGHGIAEDVSHTLDGSKGQAVVTIAVASGDQDVSPPLTSEGADGSEDGRGRHAFVLTNLTEGQPQSKRIYDPGGVSPTLQAMPTDDGGHQGGPDAPWIAVKEGEDAQSVWESRYVRNGRGAPEPVSPPLKAQSGGTGKGDAAPLTGARRLTPKECERLQGFPDSFTQYGVTDDGTLFEQSDGQRYRQMGNAVTVPVAAWIGYRIMKLMEEEKEGTGQ